MPKLYTLEEVLADGEGPNLTPREVAILVDALTDWCLREDTPYHDRVNAANTICLKLSLRNQKISQTQGE